MRVHGRPLLNATKEFLSVRGLFQAGPSANAAPEVEKPKDAVKSKDVDVSVEETVPGAVHLREKRQVYLRKS